MTIEPLFLFFVVMPTVFLILIGLFVVLLFRALWRAGSKS